MSRTITSDDASPDDLAVVRDGVAVVRDALAVLAAALVEGDAPAVTFEQPRNADFGDYASNVALQLAKRARKAPQAIAVELVERLKTDASAGALLAEASAVGGFINIRMAPAHWQALVRGVLAERERYGTAPATGERVSLEFGSANPTGPLVVVQGRTLSLGATIANAMRMRGIAVHTEWIINDAGSQIETLGRSLYARYRQIAEPDFPMTENGYPGDYLVTMAAALRERDGPRFDDEPEAMWLPFFSGYARDAIVAGQQATATRFGVTYDRWESERLLHNSGAVEAGIAAMRERGLVFEEDGAVWIRATALGDTKDRVVVRSSGVPTYFGADIAYHFAKLSRSDRAILILGPDHHGYIARLELIAKALGRPGAVRVIIAQQMTLLRDGEIVSLSKRQGTLLELDEILGEVGVDAARFFFAMTSADSPMTFDLTLAIEQSNENPVFYVQYAHARVASVERKAPPELLARLDAGAVEFERLAEPSALALARRLADFPNVVESVARHDAPHRLARYARGLASDFHAFYHECRILSEDAALSVARLALARATKLVLAKSLAILGVSAPERMARLDPADAPPGEDPHAAPGTDL